MLLALSSSRFRLFSLSLLPSRDPTLLDLCFCRQHTRSFSLFLYPRINFCLLLMAGSRPRRDRFQLSRWPSNTPPPPILSLSICSFVHHCRTSEHFFLYILTCIRPLYRSNFSLVPVVSAYIARTRFPFRLNQERDYSNSTVNDFLTVIHWSPFPLYCVLFILIIRSFGQNIWLIWIETKQIFSISW